MSKTQSKCYKIETKNEGSEHFTMSYEKFVKGVVWKVGFETKIRFENDEGKYVAYITGGIIIYGNSISALVLVRWGDGHSARIKLEEERK